MIEFLLGTTMILIYLKTKETLNILDRIDASLDRLLEHYSKKENNNYSGIKFIMSNEKENKQ